MNARTAVHWGYNVPDKVLTKPLHPEKVTAWIAMRRGIVIGPFFFEAEHGMPETVNSERYIGTALQPFWENLQRKNGVDVTQEWIQQDRATPHTADASLTWL